MSGPFVDAESAAKEWVNSLTATLVGEGKPLTKGAFLDTLRSDQIAYCEVQVFDGAETASPENPDHRASVTFLVHGRTREAAALAATALANELSALSGVRAAAGASAVCLVADNIAGPTYRPDAAGARYQVNADLTLQAA